MSKKELTAEERIKKYGNKIVGGGIFYLILKPIVMFLQTGTLFLNTVSLIINLVLMVLVILMTVGVAKKKKLGIVAGWVFEALLLVILVFEAFLLMTFGFEEIDNEEWEEAFDRYCEKIKELKWINKK